MAPPQSRFTYVLVHGTKPIYVLARAIPPHLSDWSRTKLEIQMAIFSETYLLSGKPGVKAPLFKYTWLKDGHMGPYCLVTVTRNKKEVATFRVFCNVDCDVL